jgi:prepilin-type processing-associated H-X9-DG protein
MSFITAIATATPEYRHAQPDIAAFMLKAMDLHNGEAEKLKAIFRASGIAFRHSVLSDYGRNDNYEFFPSSLKGTFPSTSERLKIFIRSALPLSVIAVEQMFNAYPHIKPGDITHLIVVCCTGMYAPGLDIDLVRELKLSRSVHRTAINFMGCYAAFNALKIADAFCKADANSKVLVVCTELCSLHFQRSGTDDNLLANALFADGSAAVLVEASSESNLQLELQQFHNDLTEKQSDDMAWSIGDVGFEMKLTSYVPDIIRTGIRELSTSLLKKIDRTVKDVKHFVIHPGGKRILKVIEQELEISENQNSSAYRVLKNFGNMSSPTVLFVLEDQLKSLTRSDVSENILSFAFGPGLTLESMVMKIKAV